MLHFVRIILNEVKNLKNKADVNRSFAMLRMTLLMQCYFCALLKSNKDS